jgi:hypothetical protein
VVSRDLILASSRCLVSVTSTSFNAYTKTKCAQQFEIAAQVLDSLRCLVRGNLLKAWPALWTFAAHPGVQPTNNHAERSLRGAVIYRKLSLGSQSESGERRIERLLSAHTTCRLQDRSLFVYLTDAITAHARGDPAPPLT